MCKIYPYRGEFCNILRFNSLQTLLVVMPSRFEYNFAIATIPCSKQLSQFSSQDVLAYHLQDLKFTRIELT